MFSKTIAEDRADRETNRKTQTVRAKSKKDRVIDQSSSVQGAPLCDAFRDVGLAVSVWSVAYQCAGSEKPTVGTSVSEKPRL